MRPDPERQRRKSGASQMGKNSLGLLKGTLDVLILKALNWAPLHGYAISRWIREVTDDVLDVQEGVLYPALHRLEKRGLVKAEWGRSETNRRVKTYQLTDAGQAVLSAEETDWDRYAEAVGKVLGTSRP
jgi:transcriptional regulator